MMNYNHFTFEVVTKKGTHKKESRILKTHLKLEELIHFTHQKRLHIQGYRNRYIIFDGRRKKITFMTLKKVPDQTDIADQIYGKI